MFSNLLLQGSSVELVSLKGTLFSLSYFISHFLFMKEKKQKKTKKKLSCTNPLYHVFFFKVDILLLLWCSASIVYNFWVWSQSFYFQIKLIPLLDSISTLTLIAFLKHIITHLQLKQKASLSHNLDVWNSILCYLSNTWILFENSYMSTTMTKSSMLNAPKLVPLLFDSFPFMTNLSKILIPYDLGCNYISSSIDFFSNPNLRSSRCLSNIWRIGGLKFWKFGCHKA